MESRIRFNSSPDQNLFVTNEKKYLDSGAEARGYSS
jgi:hypothetical protein